MMICKFLLNCTLVPVVHLDVTISSDIENRFSQLIIVFDYHRRCHRRRRRRRRRRR